MAQEKSSDLRLFKLINKVTNTRDVNMGYVLYKLDISKSSSEVSYNITIMPISRSNSDGTPVIEASENPLVTDQLKRENKLGVTVDLISNVIRFPHINKFKIQKHYRGYGLGSYAMSEIVTTLKSKYPEMPIEPVNFSFDRHNEEEDRDAFFSFMEQFGFWFQFDGENNNIGILNIERAEMFKPVAKKDTFQEVDIASFLKKLFAERSKIREEVNQIKAAHKKESTLFNRFEKDQMITFQTNVIIALAILLIIILLT